MTNEKPIISVDMLSKSFDAPDSDEKTEIFGKVCFDIYPGEFVTLIGHSGCGMFQSSEFAVDSFMLSK